MSTADAAPARSASEPALPNGAVAAPAAAPPPRAPGAAASAAPPPARAPSAGSLSDGAPAAAMKKSSSADGKLQQLLSLARDRLQAQQKLLASREARISELARQLEDERARAPAAGDARALTPARALGHVSERTVFPGSASAGRWILFEFEESEDLEWRHFDGVAAVNDFVRRDPGREPLTLPEPALDPHTAAKLRRTAEDDVRKAQAELREAKSRFAVDKARLDGLLRDATRSRVRDDDAELKKRRDALLLSLIHI